MGDEKLAKGADAKKRVGEKEARKTEITMRDCIESDLERVGEDWRKRATDRRRLIIENIAGWRKNNENGNHGQLIPHQSEEKNNKMQFHLCLVTGQLLFLILNSH